MTAAWEVTHPSLAPWTKGKSCSEQEERKTVHGAEVVKAGSRAPGQVVRQVPLRQTRGRFTHWLNRDGDPELEATAALQVLCKFLALLIKVTCSCLSSLSPPGGTKGP